MRKKPDVKKLDFTKDDFIEFMSSATPQDINDLILNRGKSRKPYCPIYLFRNKSNETELNNGG